MTDSVIMQLDVASAEGFTVKNICGCRIVFGSIPLSDFGMLTHGFSDKALIAPDIADKIGASLVIGEPNNLDDLRQMPLPPSEKRHAEGLKALQHGLPKVSAWLLEGERGASSNAMCKRIFGVQKNAGTSHPNDPDDLRRCLLFLDATDAHDQVSLMADVSAQWAGLISRWDELVATLKEEMAAGAMASRTYALMREILDDRKI